MGGSELHCRTHLAFVLVAREAGLGGAIASFLAVVDLGVVLLWEEVKLLL